MATSEQLIPIPGRLHSLAPEGHVAGADEIYDDDLQKSQSEVNALVREMGASGENHSAGLVPDPGTTQGNTKYLREDGTWATPAGQDYTEGNGISISSNAISVKAGSNLSFDANGNLWVLTDNGLQICDQNGRVRGILALPRLENGVSETNILTIEDGKVTLQFDYVRFTRRLNVKAPVPGQRPKSQGQG